MVTASIVFTFIPPPHVPHGWTPVSLFEERSERFYAPTFSISGATWNRLRSRALSIPLARRWFRRRRAFRELSYLIPHHTGVVLEELAQLQPRDPGRRCTDRATQAMAQPRCANCRE